MYWNSNKIYNHLDKFPFGMYENKSLGSVLEFDPEYFLFLGKRFKQFKIAKGIMEAVNILTGLDKLEAE